MGIFQQRPEEPTEWAGLPAEPWEPRSPAENLAPPVDALGFPGAGGSISVPLSTSIAPSTSAESPAADGTDAASDAAAPADSDRDSRA